MRREIRNKILIGIGQTAFVICLIDSCWNYLKWQLMDERERSLRVQEAIEYTKHLNYLRDHHSLELFAPNEYERRNPFNFLLYLSSMIALIYFIYSAIKMLYDLVRLGRAALLDMSNLRYLINNDPKSVLAFFFTSMICPELGIAVLCYQIFNRNMPVLPFLTMSKVLRNEPGFVCPITGKLFQDPVISFETGFSYERSALVANNYICPITGNRLAQNKIVPNHILRKLINALGKDVDKEIYAKLARHGFYIFNNLLQYLGLIMDISFHLSRDAELLISNPLAPNQTFIKPMVFSDGFTYEQDYYEQLKARKSDNPDIDIKSLFNDQVLTLEAVENKDLIKAINAINDCLEPSTLEQAIARPALAR